MSFLESSKMSNPKDFTQVFDNHNNYKHHLSALMTVKGQVDSREPRCNKLTHMRSKNFK